MALQDLTPQLRTRLNRMERVVGWFVSLATALLIFGFGYYIYHTAERKGWFKIKAPFTIFVESSSGLNVKDPVYMMGFAVGEITKVEPLQPYDQHNVKVEFNVVDPYFRRIWLGGSFVKVNAADFLGKRALEITRGTNGPAICVTQPGVWKTIPEMQQILSADDETNHWQLYQDLFDANSNIAFNVYMMLNESNLQVLAKMNLPSNSIFVYDNRIKRDRIVASWDNRSGAHRYVNFSPDHDVAWLRAVETPPISDQLQAMVQQVQNALPNILALTNKIAAMLDSTASATSNLNITVVEARPMLTNFAIISAQLREPGDPMVWALGTNGNGQLQGALTNVNALLGHTDTNFATLLINLGGITSNLNAQVQVNSNILSGISKAVTDSDSFIQGLKHHWLLRSAFKKENEAEAKALEEKAKTNSPAR